MKQHKICECGAITTTGRCKACANRARSKITWTQAARERWKGAGNPQWKGDGVGLASLHQWIRAHKTKTSCESCGGNARDIANVSGEYRRDLSDFIWLCRKCHMESDERLGKFLVRSEARRGTHEPKWTPGPVDFFGRRKASDNTSGYRGVSWDKKNRKWKAAIQIRGKYVFIGRFQDIRAAATAYDRHSAKHAEMR